MGNTILLTLIIMCNTSKTTLNKKSGFILFYIKQWLYL
nr:MAG TPA: hypothetical protein [Bacteriophage sp.]